MSPTKLLASAGAVALITTTTTALAADFPAAMPTVRAPAAEVGGWYVRGDIGVGIQHFRSFEFSQTAGPAWPPTWRVDQRDIKDTFIFAAGLGYAWDNWLRLDVTGEYRAGVNFKAVGSYDNGISGRTFNRYDGKHAAAVFLANVYLDLGTWWSFTPFIGAGAAYHMTSALTNTAINTDGAGASAFEYAGSNHSHWRFAWAAHAGVPTRSPPGSRSNSSIATSTWDRCRRLKSNVMRPAAAPAAGCALTTTSRISTPTTSGLACGGCCNRSRSTIRR